MQFSDRLNLFGDEIFAELNLKRRELEAQGREVFDLSVGTPDFAPSQHVMDAFSEASQDPANWRYSLHDTNELLDAVRKYYETRYGVYGIERDQIMSVRGTQEGMQYACAALVNPGDVALIPDPCYPVFRASALLAGATPYYYTLTAQHNFLPCVADIPEEVAERAKYMVVSLPANPVGAVGSEAIYNEILAFAKRYDVVIIHDNAYSDIIYDGAYGGSFLAYDGAMDAGVEFFSLSKSFNTTGVRISFLVGNKDIVAATAKLRSQVDFGMPYPEQAAAIACLTGPLDAVERQRLDYQERRDTLCDGLEALGWERPNAQGSMFIWARMPHGRMDSKEFALELMEKSGVIVTPGASFGPSGEGYVRLALVLPPESLRVVLRAIKESGL